MEIEIEIDDRLFASAREYSGLTDPSEIVMLALREMAEILKRKQALRQSGDDHPM